MKRVISALIAITLILSIISMFKVTASAEEASYTFEGTNPLSGWYKYNGTKDEYKAKLIQSELNTNPQFASSGSQSLYIYDSASTTYAGIASPYTKVTEYGEYTMTADARTLKGRLRMYLRCYDKNNSSYVQKGIFVDSKDSFKTYSVSYVVGPDYPNVRLIFLSGSEGDVEEGYFDNITLTKTGEFDYNGYLLQKEIQAKIDGAKPGDVIEIPDGEYSDVILNFSTSGEVGKPVTLKAKNDGKVVFKRNSAISVSGDYVRLEGLRFEEITGQSIVHFTVDSEYSGIYDCAFYDCDPNGADSERQNWIMLRGNTLTVSGCFFDKKSSYAQMVEVSKAESNSGMKDNHVIENCYFGNIKQQNVNGYEAIRIGSSTFSFENSNTTITGCFFYKCDGESEIISVKSCENIVKNNTFYNSNGALVLRHGDRNDIYGNLFIGEKGQSRTVGIRVIGEDHKIHDNYFYGIPENREIIYLYNGNPLEGIEDYWYYPVQRVEVYNNTIISGDKTLVVGDYSPSSDPSVNRIIAPSGKVYNNAIVSCLGSNPLIKNGDPLKSVTSDPLAFHSVKFENNYVFGKKLGYSENGVSKTPEGVINQYFPLKQVGKYFRPENGTGADIDIVKNAPTSPFDILSDWIKETYYDSGKVEFKVVTNDPFNNPSAHINNLIPFEVAVSAKDGTAKLYADDVSVPLNRMTASNNPAVKVTAAPDGKKVFSHWEINGAVVDEENKASMGVKSFDSSQLIVDNIFKNLDIKAVFKYLPGDINGDGVINVLDITMLRRYNAGGYSLNVIKEVVDVNKDGSVNVLDVTILRRYNAGGYGITLK